MGFKLVKNPTFPWPVEIRIPGNNGKYETEKFTVVFKRLNVPELKEVTDRVEKGELKDSSFVKEIVVGWKDVLDEKQEQVPFSEEALDSLLTVPGMASVLVKTFYGAINEASLKN